MLLSLKASISDAVCDSVVDTLYSFFWGREERRAGFLPLGLKTSVVDTVCNSMVDTPCSFFGAENSAGQDLCLSA